MFGWLDLADRVPKMFATPDKDGIAKIILKRREKTSWGCVEAGRLSGENSLVIAQ
jgi:hypothetical protein